MFNALSNTAMPAPTAPAPKKKAAPAQKDDNRGELARIIIEPALNGFTVTCDHEPKKINPKQPRYDQMPPSVETVYENVDSAIAYVTKKMQESQGAEAAEPAAPAAGAPPAAAGSDDDFSY